MTQMIMQEIQVVSETNATQPVEFAAATAIYANRALERVFGTTFDLWVHSGCWEKISWDQDPEARFDAASQAPSGMSQVFDNLAGSEPKTAVIEQSEGKHLVVLPIRDACGAPLFASKEFESNEPIRLRQLADSFLREEELRARCERLQEESESLAQQVTDDFEELTYLRRMAQHLDVSEANHSIRRLAEAMLPLLANGIKAESLVFVTATSSSVADELGRVPHKNTFVLAGSHVVDESSSARLIATFQDAAQAGPVVKNRFHQTENGAEFPAVRSFIISPVSKNGRLMGWLLALNRQAKKDDPYLTSPWALSHHEFGTVEASLLSSAASLLATHAHNIELVNEKGSLLINMARTLVSAIEARDTYTHGHSERVALFAERLGEQYGLDRDSCERLYLTGLLHDVGKIGISDAVLLKPGRLTVQEFEEIKRHPEKGWAILQVLKQLSYVLPGVLYHHERYDGGGYPDGLAGDDIPLDGRILAVVDAYDAMTSDRPYRTPLSQQSAEEMIRDGAGTQWDPTIVHAFLQAIPDMIAIRESYRPAPQPIRDNVPRSELTFDSERDT